MDKSSYQKEVINKYRALTQILESIQTQAKTITSKEIQRTLSELNRLQTTIEIYIQRLQVAADDAWMLFNDDLEQTLDN